MNFPKKFRSDINFCHEALLIENLICISQKRKKFVDLIDRYLAEQDKQNKLTPDTFIKLASAVPKEKRNSYDNLMETLLNLLKKGKKKK